MAVRRILRMGDPRLLQPSAAVAGFDTARLHALVADLFDTMHAADGAGLAAPQIGVPLRVVVFGFERNPRYPDSPPVPVTALVNPELEPLSADIEEGWEGCLSVPGLRGMTPRHTRLRYRARDAAGKPFEIEAEGFHARLVQHECDHLDGILYPQRMTDHRLLGFVEELTEAGLMDSGCAPCEDERERPAVAAD